MSTDHMLVWHRKLKRPARCPACDNQGDIPLFLDIPSRIPPHGKVTFAKCPKCQGLFQLGFAAPSYSTEENYPLKFYIEQGAGLDTLVLPAFIARPRSPKRYLEVGCGFGFGLDFARRMFGWEVCGIDPSYCARQGQRMLGVPIESRYFAASDVGMPPYDAIAAIEVLEHTEEPIEFLRILRGNLTQNGILILTTPNADYVEFAREKPGSLAVLSPGFHATIFTAKSLEIALRKAGFAETQIVVRGATLLALAGPRADRINLDEVVIPAIYRAYLEGRFEVADPQSSLGIGFGYRLFKHLVNGGMYAEAELLRFKLAESVQARDNIDILNPHRLVANLAHPWEFETLNEQLPACLVGLLYFSAMLRLNGHQDRPGALAYLYATHVMAGIFRRVMLGLGIDDGETADLEFQARKHVKLVLDWMSG